MLLQASEHRGLEGPLGGEDLVRPGLEIGQDVEVAWDEVRDHHDIVVPAPEKKGLDLLIKGEGAGAPFPANIGRSGGAVGHDSHCATCEVRDQLKEGLPDGAELEN